jgi:hypothetical protein
MPLARTHAHHTHLHAHTQAAFDRAYAQKELRAVQTNIFNGNQEFIKQKGWRTFVGVEELRVFGKQLYELVPDTIDLSDGGGFQPIFNRNREQRFQ